MGCCLSKKPSPSPASNGVVKAPDLSKSDPIEPVIKVPAKEETKSKSESVLQKEEEEQVLVIQEKPEESPASVTVEKPMEAVVRSSSCTKEEVDAILIQCGKMSRSNSARRYSGSKRSFDVEEEDEERRPRHRVNGSPRRRTPSRERGGRRVSRSPAKRSVTVPARGNNGEPSVKRNTVKRNIGEACRKAEQSPFRRNPLGEIASSVQPPPSSCRKVERSPYRRNPLGEIDQNSKVMKNRDTESANHKPTKPQVISRSRSLRKSRDFDFTPETLLPPNQDNNSNYTALLLKDIQNFHAKSNNVHDDPSVSLSLLPSCVSKACSIVEAVADLNSTTNNTCLISDSNQFRFTSTAIKADLMEPSFEKYVTVKRGQEYAGSNNLAAVLF